jgi:hypothetical protein
LESSPASTPGFEETLNFADPTGEIQSSAIINSSLSSAQAAPIRK